MNIPPPSVVSQFPPPPPFFRLFSSAIASSSSSSTSSVSLFSPTSSNIFSPLNNNNASTSSNGTTTLPNIGCDGFPTGNPLIDRFLRPPPTVIGSYRMFGEQYTTEEELPSLEALGIKQLFPKGRIDPVNELRRLNRALLFNFLEFLDALVTEAPEGRAKVDQKIEDIQLVVINMHHIINTHRPHQSRQILIATMTEQINRRLQTVTEIESKFDWMQNKLKEAEGILNESKQPAQHSGLQNSTESDSVMEMEDALIDPFQDLQSQINDIIE